MSRPASGFGEDNEGGEQWQLGNTQLRLPLRNTNVVIAIRKSGQTEDTIQQMLVREFGCAHMVTQLFLTQKVISILVLFLAEV